MLKVKYTLILAGGGAKGAYQIGVWKALKELKVKINAIIGNSVGALNGALIIQNNIKKALKLWESLTLDKIVIIPKELIKNGVFHIDSKNLFKLKDFQKLFFKNRGLDTAPLKNLIKNNIDEKKVRKSKIDFGLITYQLNNLKPLEIFLEDMPDNSLEDYLIASASIPFLFKKAKIRGKQFIDGGVYDNMPFSMAKKRGYNNLIIVDISGLGVNKRPDIIGTNIYYIKNSINKGNLLYFSPDFIKEYINLGYLDTLKIFNKVDGINFFYKNDNKILNKLEKLLFNRETFNVYSKYLKNSKKHDNDKEIKNSIREILPEKYKNYGNIIIALSECAALSLNIERIKLYSYKEFLYAIWKKYNKIEKDITSVNITSVRDFFEIVSQKLKNLDFSVKKLSKISTFEYEKAFEIIFGKDNANSNIKTIANFFPYLLASKIFFALLKAYFK